MTKIKDTAKLVLSRTSVEQLMTDELLPYGMFADLRIVSIEADNGDDDEFLTIYMDQKPQPKATTDATD